MENEIEENYEMPISEAISEHERLVKVLKSGDKTAIALEAEIQQKELNKIKRLYKKYAAN